MVPDIDESDSVSYQTSELLTDDESMVAAILQWMHWWRHSRLVRAIVMVLLLWTAADLSNASLCALDNEGSSTIPVSTAGDYSWSDSSGDRAPIRQPRQHIDDCFCCSHCVDVQAFSPRTVAVPVELQLTPFVVAAPRFFTSPLYHPPLS